VVQLRVVAETLPAEAWRTVTWRHGVAEKLVSRFAALRVRAASGDARRSEPRPEQWLLMEWPEGEPKPVKFWFSTVPADTPIERLVYLAKLRWMIERDYLELKQELGLGHYEGRGWRGFHHHAALCIAAYGFLVAERAAIPPSGPGAAGLVEAPPLPASYRPRGGPASHRAPCPALDRDPAPAHRPSADPNAAKMSMLRTNNCATSRPVDAFVTQ
jgi:SRSO17 transposase